MTREDIKFNIRSRVKEWDKHQMMGVDPERHSREVGNLSDKQLLAYYNYLFPRAKLTKVDPRPKLYFPPKDVLHDLLDEQSNKLLGKRPVKAWEYDDD